MRSIFLLALALPALLQFTGVNAQAPASPYSKWTRGPSTDPGFFPIAVWLQSPRNAEKFHQAGINTYVGFDGNPTDADLSTLKAAGIKLICGQNPESLKHIDDSTIIGWMHGDEPDNAQSLPDNKGYGPPISPQKIIDEYNDIVKADPTRPVMLNLGQGVAWNEYYGRGTRTGHAEDYAEYIKGADMVSFDIYPIAGGSPQTQDKLWYVPQGVDHLVQIGNGNKVPWNCLECTHIGSDKIATPQQVRSEAWMAIIHGSMGLIYFVHQFTPTFVEDELLQEPEMLAAVTALNKQITLLAPVLNSPTVAFEPAGVISQGYKDAQVAYMVKSYQGSSYFFAAEERGRPAKAILASPNLKAASTATVLDENRTVDVKDAAFTDTFAPWDVHIYQIKD